MNGTYIYPENLKGKSTFLLWTLRDLITIVFSAVFSAACAALLHTLVPAVATGVYAFLTMRIDYELNISDYIRFAVKFFITSQQTFYWRLKEDETETKKRTLRKRRSGCEKHR